MAITESTPNIRPVTGFSRVDEAARAAAAKAILPLVKNPIEMPQRSSNLSTTAIRTLSDVQAGYLVDSYIHQSAGRYAEKVIKEGFYLSSPNEAVVKYIATRFDMMTAATGVFWQRPVVEALRDYTKLANGFLIKARFKKGESISGPKVKGIRKLQGLNNKGPVAGYYRADPLKMEPRMNKAGFQDGWIYKAGSGGAGSKGNPEFDLDDVVHITYDRQPGDVFGTSPIACVLDDVRALRQVEEMVIQLIFKSLNPLIHHEVPDTTGTGRGRQSDVDAAAGAHDISAVNGYLVTPVGHKLQMLGVESKALRAEGYLKVLRERVYAGLGINPVMMGESGTTGMGVADSFTSIMHDRIRFYQKEFADFITYDIIWELLMEGGFMPIFDERDRCYWVFNEVDVDRKMREEAHQMLKYHGNLITEDEARASLKLQPLSDSERKGTYLNLVQIPQTVAGAQARANAAGSDSGGNGSQKKSPGQSTPRKKEAASLKYVLSNHVLSCYASDKPVTVENLECVVDGVLSRYPGEFSDEARAGVKQAVDLAIAGHETSPAAHIISRLHGHIDTYLTIA